MTTILFVIGLGIALIFALPYLAKGANIIIRILSFLWIAFILGIGALMGLTILGVWLQ
jgi:hypothetical protein